MKIEQLKDGVADNIVGKIIELSEPKEIMTKFGTQVTLTNAVLEDETGTIKLSLWGKDSEGIKQGSMVKIDKAFVKTFREELQLSKGKGGKVTVV